MTNKTGKNNQTPGPWKIGRECQNVDDPIFWRIDVLNSNGTLRVAQVLGIGGAAAEANARLVAGAPDLLVACNVALTRLRNMAEPTGNQDKGRRLSSISLLGTAIAKVEGRE